MRGEYHGPQTRPCRNPDSEEVTSMQDPKKLRRIVGAAIGAGLGTALGGPIGAAIGTAVGHWIADKW